MIYLSILIPTIEERKEQLDKLVNKLNLSSAGYFLNHDFEILTESDNREKTVGEKRNILLERAKGIFTVFIDDDDDIHNSYIQLIIDAIKYNWSVMSPLNNPDCIGFKGEYYRNGVKERDFIHSLGLGMYYDDGATYYRSVNHLNPIRSDISKAYKFKHINSGEDQEWATRILCDCKFKKQLFIDEVMYYYMFDTNKTATNKFT